VIFELPVEAALPRGSCLVARRKRIPAPPRAHVAPAPAAKPCLLEEVPLLIRLEREVEEEFRPQMLARLNERVRQEGERLAEKGPPHCAACGKSMKSRGRRSWSFVCRFGKVKGEETVYRCKPCRKQHRPLQRALGVEIGRISGSLARLVALVGIVVPYPLAARLVEQFFGVQLSAMTVWRCVQRLGEACEQYTEATAAYYRDPVCADLDATDAPPAVVLGVDGCALGMQVRSTRRRRTADTPVLPPLPPVEEGHFREVKTGVLLLPSERVESSPGRHTVVRRALVTCFGNADQVFDRLWSKLHQLGWLGVNTVVVVVGDGAEWIWNRASMFIHRCEILDFWHAVEKAWSFARLQFGQGSARADRFMERVAGDLRAGKVLQVIARLKTLQTFGDEAEETLQTLVKYYTDNATRMRYDEYLRKGYGIGSGAVESAHKQVVHARLRQAGMRWSEAGARRLLALRVLLLNNSWSQLDRMVMARPA
jgi:predicted RNA-binding Zn-ribbon protein involved in translation (DUF1610 family)